MHVLSLFYYRKTRKKMFTFSVSGMLFVTVKILMIVFYCLYYSHLSHEIFKSSTVF